MNISYECVMRELIVKVNSRILLWQSDKINYIGGNSMLITMNDVYVSYPNGVIALKKCNVSVQKGEFVFIVGSSGSGKSTFIKTLLGEIKVMKGNIVVDGSHIEKLSKRKLPHYRRKLGVVFQEFRLLGDRNVYDNVALAQRVIGAPYSHIDRRVMKMLKTVGLEEKAASYPNELSGGEQQRVGIARALVNKPAILLADEPTGNLDPKTSWDIMQLLNELNKLGMTIIVVTHNDEIVDKMKKRVITLNEGEIVSDIKQGGYIQ